MTGSTFQTTGTTESTTDGLQYIGNGSSGATVSVTGSTFKDNNGEQFDFQSTSGDTGTNAVTFSNNTLSEAGSNSGGGAEVLESGASSTSLTFNNNTITGPHGDGMTFDDNGTTAYHGTISGNTVGNPAVACSGASDGGNDISATAEGNSSTVDTLAITNNNLYQYNGFAGLYVNDREGAATMNMTITGNTIADPAPPNTCTNKGTAAYGLNLVSGAQSSDSGTVCADVTGNSIKGSEGDPSFGGIEDFEYDEDGNAIFKLPGFTGGSNDESADSNGVDHYSQTNNAGNGTPSVDTFIQQGSGFVDPNAYEGGGQSGGYFFGASSCPTPP